MKTCKTKHTIFLNFNFKNDLKTHTSKSYFRHEIIETRYRLDHVYIEINFELKHN